MIGRLIQWLATYWLLATAGILTLFATGCGTAKWDHTAKGNGGLRIQFGTTVDVGLFNEKADENDVSSATIAASLTKPAGG